VNDRAPVSTAATAASNNDVSVCCPRAGLPDRAPFQAFPQARAIISQQRAVTVRQILKLLQAHG
jgi:hypothetical protein